MYIPRWRGNGDSLSTRATSWWGTIDIKVARRALRGHTYSEASERKPRHHQLHSVRAFRDRCVSLRKSEAPSESDEERKNKIKRRSARWRRTLLFARSVSTVRKIHPSGIKPKARKIPTFSEVCKRGAFRIKPPNGRTKILSDMTACCQEPQSYHMQATMNDR